jgi:hypothetical protein
MHQGREEDAPRSMSHRQLGSALPRISTGKAATSGLAFGTSPPCPERPNDSILLTLHLHILERYRAKRTPRMLLPPSSLAYWQIGQGDAISRPGWLGYSAGPVLP